MPEPVEVIRCRIVDCEQPATYSIKIVVPELAVPGHTFTAIAWFCDEHTKVKKRPYPSLNAAILEVKKVKPVAG